MTIGDTVGDQKNEYQRLVPESFIRRRVKKKTSAAKFDRAAI